MHTKKSEVSLPTPDFHTFKYIVGVIPKELRDVAILDLPHFLLQTEMDIDERILLRINGAVVLLLVKSDATKW